MNLEDKDWLSEKISGCTFDDLLLRPGWGKASSRKGISLKTRFSEHISLNIPLVSANMDTITGARMAIAMAKEGGIGIIHRYLSIDDQCERVREVKRAENFVIGNPYRIMADNSVGEARDKMKKNKVGGLVVVDNEGVLIGILTDRDIRFCTDELKVFSRMTTGPDLITASYDITIEKAKNLIDINRLEKLPLVDDEFKSRGLITSQDIENLDKFPLTNKDKNGQLVVGAAIGASGDYLERSAELIKAGVDVLVIDIANAQSTVGDKAISGFKNRFPEAELVVGNVALPEAVLKFKDLGVHGVKIGLGPGSACTTRRNTNIGVPQAEAVFSCSGISNIPTCADGGIRRNGHIGLALLLGGSTVMIGGVFAGTDESPGLVFRDSTGKEVKSFRGMASREAMYDKLKNEEYDDPYEATSRISPEGIERKVEYKGSVIPIIMDMIGNLSSTISYIGATSLEEAKSMFLENPKKYIIRLTEASKFESWDR
jgi:IMP dehydrogenase